MINRVVRNILIGLAFLALIGTAIGISIKVFRGDSASPSDDDKIMLDDSLFKKGQIPLEEWKGINLPLIFSLENYHLQSPTALMNQYKDTIEIGEYSAQEASQKALFDEKGAKYSCTVYKDDKWILVEYYKDYIEEENKFTGKCGYEMIMRNGDLPQANGNVRVDTMLVREFPYENGGLQHTVAYEINDANGVSSTLTIYYDTENRAMRYTEVQKLSAEENTTIESNVIIDWTKVTLFKSKSGETDDELSGLLDSVGIHGQDALDALHKNNKYTVSIICEEGIKVTGAGEYAPEEEVSVFAEIQDPSIQSIRWSSTSVQLLAPNQKNPGTFKMPESNVELVVEAFRISQDLLSIKHGEGISKISKTVSNKTVTLKAELEDGYTFKEWISEPSGFGGTEKDITFRMPNHKLTMIATAVPISNSGSLEEVTITLKAGTGVQSVSAVAEGKIAGNPFKILQGRKILLNSLLEPGYYSVSWTANGKEIKANTDGIFEYYSYSDATLIATAKKKASLNCQLQPGLKWSASGNPSGSYTPGDKVPLRVVCEENYIFDGWYANGVSTGLKRLEDEYIMQEGNVVLEGRATYVSPIPKYELVLMKDTGIQSVQGAGSFAKDSTVSISASVELGYTFSGWYEENDTLYSSEASTSVTISSEKRLKAKAEPKQYSVTIRSRDGVADIYGTGFYKYKSMVNISYTVEPGYIAQGWDVENGDVSQDKLGQRSTSFEMPRENVVLIPKIQKAP